MFVSVNHSVFLRFTSVLIGRSVTKSVDFLSIIRFYFIFFAIEWIWINDSCSFAFWASYEVSAKHTMHTQAKAEVLCLLIQHFSHPSLCLSSLNMFLQWSDHKHLHSKSTTTSCIVYFSSCQVHRYNQRSLFFTLNIHAAFHTRPFASPDRGVMSRAMFLGLSILRFSTDWAGWWYCVCEHDWNLSASDFILTQNCIISSVLWLSWRYWLCFSQQGLITSAKYPPPSVVSKGEMTRTETCLLVENCCHFSLFALKITALHKDKGSQMVRGSE